jgi:hypothetical protein
MTNLGIADLAFWFGELDTCATPRKRGDGPIAAYNLDLVAHHSERRVEGRAGGVDEAKILPRQAGKD